MNAHNPYAYFEKVPFQTGHQIGSPLWRKELSNYIANAVEDDSVTEYGSEKVRTHLGASEIGDPCSRRQWYGFRWVKKQVFTGTMYRLFNRGHREEERFIHRLNRVGIFANDIDPETGKQFRITNEFNRHFGGSLDSVLYIPWLHPSVAHMLGEFKTHNRASFDKLKKDGVQKSKSRHFAQMSVYGRRKGFQLGLYCAVCKDTDRFHFEVVALDHKLGAMLEEKADAIILTQKAPPKVSETPTYFECRMCNFHGVCHMAQPVERNCRACVHAEAVPDGTWKCGQYAVTLPEDFIPTGCQSFYPIV